MRKFSKIAAAVAFCLVPFAGMAQDSTITTKKQAELLIPRPALQPVQSMDETTAKAMDTLSTANPHIKIILFADYT